MRRLTMPTPSNEKRCSNYAAKDYEKQNAILRTKLEDAETQRANETKMRRHYEHLATDTKKADAKCKELASLQTHVAKTLARIDVDEEQLAQAKSCRGGLFCAVGNCYCSTRRLQKRLGRSCQIVNRAA